MSNKIIWIGMAILRLKGGNPKKEKGFVGGYAGIACLAENLVDAIKLISEEFGENGYELIGVESFMSSEMIDRELTVYEKDLINATKSYPVQFKDVHLYKADA